MLGMKRLLLSLPFVAMAAVDAAKEPTSTTNNATKPGDYTNASLIPARDQEPILSFWPSTSVTDQALVDLDQEAIETQLALNTDEGLLNALKLYVAGAHSGSYAELTLQDAIKVSIPRGRKVLGQTESGTVVQGRTLETCQAGDTVLLVRYTVSPPQSKSVNETRQYCHVGGNPDPVTNGCFAPKGKVQIGKDSTTSIHGYTYNPLVSNFNGRTLQAMSLEARDSYFDCPTCPYPAYLQFYIYYEVYDYANHFILSAFQGSPTNFVHGNAPFNLYGREGRNEAIKRATVLMSVWMVVIGQLDDAVDDCFAGCDVDECNPDGRYNSWDAAVALYTGSMATRTTTNSTTTTTNSTTGYLLYGEAQNQCQKFGTCDNETGLANVNLKIFEQFMQGQNNWMSRDCSTLIENVHRITQLMTIPLVQGVLEHAYRIDKQRDAREQTEAAGAVFAAALCFP